MNNPKNFIFNKNPMLILSYLSKNIYSDNISSQIAKELQLGVGSVHGILKEFENMQIVGSRRVGKSILYEVKKDNSLIKSFRIFDNLLELDELVQELKSYCRKIVLFGSCARGEDNSNSDYDIFIVCDECDKEKVILIINDYNIGREIKPIIVDEIELFDLEKNDAVFYNEIMKGIELWEVSNDYNR